MVAASSRSLKIGTVMLLALNGAVLRRNNCFSDRLKGAKARGVGVAGVVTCRNLSFPTSARRIFFNFFPAKNNSCTFLLKDLILSLQGLRVLIR
jgi:hypothetical protein